MAAAMKSFAVILIGIPLVFIVAMIVLPYIVSSGVFSAEDSALLTGIANELRDSFAIIFVMLIACSVVAIVSIRGR